MKRLYGNLKMSWPKVIIFSLIVGIYTGLIMMVDALDETSFQDIGISYEWWVIFAVIIVVNCSKNWEAMLKCFVFFLISQPVVYAVEVLFGEFGIDQAIVYFRTWLPMIILTLPGGFIAFYCKKQNMLGAVILGLGNAIQCLFGAVYFIKAVSSFPHHILSCIICFASMFIMSICIQKEKKYRLVSILLPFVLTALAVVILLAMGRTLV
jgi:hypothetical protein